jgi:cell division protein FtsQ
MRRILKILILVPVIYLVILPIYLASSVDSGPCRGIAIDIRDSSEYHFVTRRQLLNLAYGNTSKIVGQPLKNIDLVDIEKRIGILRELKSAEVYRTIDGTIHISADQREPLLRIMPNEGGDYFLDEDGIIVRRRNLYTPRLHIAGGNINITQQMLNGVSVFDTSIRQTVLRDIFKLVKYINGDDFLSAQIDQIYIDSNNEIDLIPRMGNQTIHLGSMENFRGKLRNLEAFYEKVLPEVGWNKYSLINLEFRDQIICKKR